MSALTSSILTDQVDLYRGMHRVLRLTVTLNGEPYDLTGATLYFTAKCRTSDSTNLFQLTSAPGGAIALSPDPRDGYADITFSTSVTSSVDAGSYIYDIVLETSTGERFLIDGPSTLRILQGVTRF